MGLTPADDGRTGQRISAAIGRPASWAGCWAERCTLAPGGPRIVARIPRPVNKNLTLSRFGYSSFRGDGAGSIRSLEGSIWRRCLGPGAVGGLCGVDAEVDGDGRRGGLSNCPG